ncbi:C1 family peptidase [Paenibacillus sp. GP183]|uniref:C1 family peptidase n=1 Tax=Paenibacillus sp. GP183 TaxID=1882751 RepID=UPI000B81F4A8|nr:C1 family peptidase [Paenibacillus sp. GP183]
MIIQRSLHKRFHAGAFKKIKEYHRVTSFIDLQHALAEGFTVVLGMTVFDSFQYIGAEGIFPMPKTGESVLGGHAMLAVGYKTINGIVYAIVRNSWGSAWGDGGYCYIPSDYFRKTVIQLTVQLTTNINPIMFFTLFE